jgi:DNA-binding CsgD family transcriptional regulator
LLFTGAANSEISAEASRRFLANEYGADDVVKFTDVAAAKVPAQSLFAVTAGEPATSARWRDVIEPLGWGDELRVALRDRGGVWGFLCLHRGAGDRPFDAAEIRAVCAIVPELAAAFRRTTLAAAAATGGVDGPGVIVLGADLAVEALTGSASELLSELMDSDPLYAPPMPIASLASRVLETGTAHRLTLQAPSGRWISLHAGLLEGSDPARIAIVVEPPTPVTILPRFALAVGLTPREVEVTAALLRGESNRLTARRLRVSELTLQTQVRSVFAKAGVHSRGELVARLLSPH